MSQSRSLIPVAGIVSFALLLGLWWVPASVKDIEADIARRSDAALRTAPGVQGVVTGQQVTLTGQVESEEIRGLLRERIASLGGVSLVDDQLSVAVAAAPAVPDHYDFEASRSDGEVLLSGFVASDAQRASVVGLARQVFAPVRVVDRLKSAPGAPPGFDALIKFGLTQLGHLDSGRFRFSGENAQLTGVAPSPASMLEIESAFATRDGRDLTLAASLTLRPADAARRQVCQSAFDRVINASSIGFASGRASISPDSFPLLDNLATTAKDCADVTIEVRGHTDSRGDPRVNKRLSRLRAQAVVDYLEREGVSIDIMRARGMGDELPIASNDSVKGRAANRRIEIVVLDGSQ